MARIRKSRVDTTNFTCIPKPNELDDKELLEKKYKNKKLLLKEKQKD